MKSFKFNLFQILNILAITVLLLYSDATPGGRLYKKGQRPKIRWSNDEYLISIGRRPNPPAYRNRFFNTYDKTTTCSTIAEEGYRLGIRTCITKGKSHSIKV